MRTQNRTVTPYGAREWWCGTGKLLRQPAGADCDYAGTLKLASRGYALRGWITVDGAGAPCISFGRSSTRPGCIWRAKDKLNAWCADYYGIVALDGRKWRVRAWLDAEHLDVKLKE